jgi:hypothetical protein
VRWQNGAIALRGQVRLLLTAVMLQDLAAVLSS